MSDGAPEAFRHDGFGRKVGPLPIWGWALVLAAGVYIFYRFYAGRQAASTGSQAAIDTQYATNGSNPSTTPYAGTSGQNGSGSQFGSFFSNDAYNAAAIGEASQFSSTGLQVQSALAKYESGAPLTPSEGGLINQILGAFGGLPSAPQSTSQIITPTSSLIPSDVSQYTFTRDTAGTIFLYNPNTGKSAPLGNVPQVQYIQGLIAGKPASQTGITLDPNSQTAVNNAFKAVQ